MCESFNPYALVMDLACGLGPVVVERIPSLIEIHTQTTCARSITMRRREEGMQYIGRV